MGFCKFCHTYFIKKKSGDFCKKCSQELSSTPPSINNSMKQLENIMQKRLSTLNYEHTFKKNATLMDLAADKMLTNKKLIIKLVDILPDGNLPWFALLKAWYRQNKRRGRHLNDEQNPRDRLLKLMDINLIEYKIKDTDDILDDILLDDTYIVFNKDIECLEELEKLEDLDEWYFEIDL